MVEKFKQANRSLKRDINLIMDKIGLNRTFEHCSEQDVLRKLVVDWVNKELTWQRVRWTGIFHGYLNSNTSEEEILGFQMRTAICARNSREDLSTAIAVLIDGESPEAHEKLNTLDQDIKRWTRPIGSFLLYLISNRIFE